MTTRLEIETPGLKLRVGAGEIVALLGANGAGKSALLRAIMGFEPLAGRISLDGRDLGRTPPFRRNRLGIGYCPEGRRVFPHMTVSQNLIVAARSRATTRLGEIFSLFPALAAREGALAGQLSGGEQQMLAMGRALMTEPKLLLLDEPSLGLSPQLTEMVLTRLRDIASRGTAVLVAEQNAANALAAADRAYLLRLGRIVREGPAAGLRADATLEEAFLGG
ncbi:MAG: ATP-binding cassette domain-containing protein [Alphaproteobacteria bacterium]|nr:ATP-binding cassette domain-containing protein [Alphaproteobacteria bacterium]